MTPRAYVCLSAFLLALPDLAAAAVPAPLAGERLSGLQLPANVYTTDFGGATSASRRLLLNKDGSYVLTRFGSTFYSSSFGTTGYPITCQMMDVTVERGTFSVSGGKITYKVAKVDRVDAFSPNRLNNGCKRNAGIRTSRAGASPETMTWSVVSGNLTVKTANDSVQHVRRTSETGLSASTGLPPGLLGEWHSGRISPSEYYNTATGKWAEASGTGVILKLHANSTYERTGLLVATTYGCTSKLLVQEQGTVRADGTTLTFTPTTSSATGSTCTPGRVSAQKNHIRPYSEQALAKVDARGQPTLSLVSNSGETLFNRPAGPVPQGQPAGPGAAEVPTPHPSTPPAPAPAKWNARGEWDAVITMPEGTIRTRFSLDDDEPRILGSGFSGDDAVGWIQGNSQTGALRIGLEIEGGHEVELSVTGTFSGDSYRGRFTAMNASGQALAGGTLTMTRRPASR